jgi:hypothetical protein
MTRRHRAAAWPLIILAPAAVLSCSSGSPPAAAPLNPPAAPSASASCGLKTTFDYIVRDSGPGTAALASEIGNVDYSACASSLSTFRQEAGQAGGECTTIALASRNPGYNVSAVPAPPLKDVIMSAGPGC